MMIKATIFALLMATVTTSAHAQGYSNPLESRAVKNVTVEGTVARVMTGGVLVQCKQTDKIGNARASGIVFLQISANGLVDGSPVKYVAVEAGTYSYASAQGIQRTVRAYKAQ
jgi:hypothetical protein